MTSAGAATWAAAPAQESRSLTDDHARIRDAMACPRRSWGTLTTEAVLAAIWYTPNAADSEQITSETARPGCRAVSVSVPQVSTASGPIDAARWRGRANRMNSGIRIVVLAAADTSTRPVASGPPPSCAAWGAAIPSGIV